MEIPTTTLTETYRWSKVKTLPLTYSQRQIRLSKKKRKSGKSTKGDFASAEFQEIAEESDGETALRDANETSRAQRGPVNKTLVHWNAPRKAVSPNGEKRWEFECRYCNGHVSLISSSLLFTDEFDYS